MELQVQSYKNMYIYCAQKVACHTVIYIDGPIVLRSVNLIIRGATVLLLDWDAFLQNEYGK